MARSLILCLLLVSVACAAPPQEFSVRRVMLQGKSKETQRIRVRGMQICFQDSPTQRSIFDHSKGLRWLVNDATKTYSQGKVTA